MTRVQFVAPGVMKEVRVEIDRDRPPTLLAVALDNQVPVLFTCEAGACGACLVTVRTLDAGASQAPVGDTEAFLLQALGHQSPPAAAQAEAFAPQQRLACQYVLGEADIRVELPIGMG